MAEVHASNECPSQNFKLDNVLVSSRKLKVDARHAQPENNIPDDKCDNYKMRPASKVHWSHSSLPGKAREGLGQLPFWVMPLEHFEGN